MPRSFTLLFPAWSKLAEQGLFRDSPALDVTVSSIEIDAPLAFLSGLNQESSSEESKAFNSTTALTTQSTGGAETLPTGVVFFDASHTAFAFYPPERSSVPIDPSTFEKDQNTMTPRYSDLLPLRSSFIVRIARDSDLGISCSSSLSRSSSSPHSTGIHLLQVYDTISSDPAPRHDAKQAALCLETRLKDITRALNALQLLTQERGVDTHYKLSSLSISTHQHLPWHVAVLLSLRHPLSCE